MRCLTAALLVLLSACSKETPTSGGGPSNGGVQPVVGAYCSADKVSTAVAQGDDWYVTIYWNETTYRYIAGTDGIVRQQEVRTCRSGSCFLVGGVSRMSAPGAIQYCRDLLIP